ncbi:AVID protein, partial [Sula dactylatra]|nr:AVID protein [Sula dactylatra]
LGTCLLIPWQCDRTGWWENELGSRMHVSVVNSQGNFYSEYHTAMSSTQKPIEPSPLSAPS